jgi:hypothetical protein
MLGRTHGISVTETVLDAEYRIAVLEGIIEVLLSTLEDKNKIGEAELSRIREEAFDKLKLKYPDQEITLQKEK